MDGADRHVQGDVNGGIGRDLCCPRATAGRSTSRCLRAYGLTMRCLDALAKAASSYASATNAVSTDRSGGRPQV